MKIGYFADGPWAHEALEKIQKDSRFQVLFIVPRYDSQDPVLKKWAERLKVDFLPIQNVNKQKNIEKLREYEADIFVSMSFNQILREDILKTAPLGFINCHAGNLPHYRGRNVLNWVLINDEKKFGVTVHYIDEGIDTGDIILQQQELISDEDDYSTLLIKAQTICADLLYESLILIVEHGRSIPVVSQKDMVGFYCGRRREGDEWIDWGWSSRRIFNFVRGITIPGPCARTLLNGEVLKIKKASVTSSIRSYIGTPGEIVGIQEQGVLVKTGDSALFVEFAENESIRHKLRIGMRLVCKVDIKILELEQRITELSKQISARQD